MSLPKNNHTQKDQPEHLIRVAILAEEPLGWGSGKHFFPEILHNYTWTTKNGTFTIKTQYVYDNDILKGCLNTKEYNVLLVPGGGVGDGHALMKGFYLSWKSRTWKKQISLFIKGGGGYVGICGGAALITNLKTAERKPRTFLERQYNKSALGVSCVSSYYKSIAFPLFYPFQKNHPEKIGAIAYVFSFAPGETVDGARIHTGGAPIDIQLCRDHPIFSDLQKDTEQIRWWGGPALIVPSNPDREVQILGRYPAQELSDNKNIRIYAWRYTGGIYGLFSAFLNAAQYIKKEGDSLKNVFLYSFFMAGDWKCTDRVIELDYSNKPCITAEVYPNDKKARILLCTAHPEYIVWSNGHITELKNEEFHCLGTGLYQWKGIESFTNILQTKLTHTWWMVRRFVAWAAKVPNDQLPPIQKDEIIKEESDLFNNVLWDGSLCNQMENI